MIEWLNNKGVWVLRMGRVMNRRSSFVSDRFIDYAFDDDKSDLLDIWLFANCTACVSTASGLDTIPVIYGRPVLFVNAMPLSHFASYAESTWVPKHLEHIEDGSRCNADEHLRADFIRSEEFTDAGLRLTPLSPEELVTSISEFWRQHIEVDGLDELDDAEMQSRFRLVLRSSPRYGARHSFMHARARVASWWLLDEGLVSPSGEERRA
jgi:putative glycosyltransferase (TIGR04372 family)